MQVEHDKSKKPFFKAENGTCFRVSQPISLSQIASPDVIEAKVGKCLHQI